MKPPKISNEEWFQISNALEQHHAIFYKIWQMGKPHFVNDIETAAVQWGNHGEFVYFLFNPKFWHSLDFNTKCFVICHEALHVIFNHGIRTKGIDRLNAAACNAALDIVINHTLLEQFGFIRSQIMGQEKLCWVDTIFGNKNPLPPTNEMFEYYYNLYDKVYRNGQHGSGQGKGDFSMGEMANGQGTVDDHRFLTPEDDENDNFIKKLQEELHQEEINSLKNLLEKHHQNESDSEVKSRKAGAGTGSWVFVPIRKVAKKKKWETIIKRWSRKYTKQCSKENEQWARLNRRMTMLPNDMFLPSDMEYEEKEKEKNRIKVYFYLDTSGSCWSFKERFFDAAKSLSEERFDLRVFCFDTCVEETTLESGKVYGNGGTSFGILERFIQRDIKDKKEPYPEGVFVLTDGYAMDKVMPEKPENWHWFLTPGGSQHCYDPSCNSYNLTDYE